MKHCFVLMIIVFYLCAFPVSALAQSDKVLDSFSDQTQKIEQAVPEEIHDQMSESNITIEAIFQGDFSWNSLWKLIKESITSSFSEVNQMIISLLILCIISVISGILIEHKSTEYILLLFSCVLLLSPVVECLRDAASALESGCVFMTALIPVYAALLFSSGSAATGGSYTTIMFALAQGIEMVAGTFLVPVCGCLLALSVSSSLIQEKLKNIVHFVTRSVTVCISVVLGVFVGVLGLQTTLTKATDSVALRTARYFSGSFIPIAGSFVSESLSVVVTSFGLMRSSIGIFSIISLLLIHLPVLLKTVIIKILLTVFGYLFESVGTSSMTSLLKSVGGVLSILICLEVSCMIIFIISTALTIHLSV